MRAFARTQIPAIEGMAFGVRGLIEVRPPLDEFLHALGTLRHQRLGGGAVDDSVAGVHRVFEVQGDVILALHGDGDAALRVVRVRLAEGFLGDDENLAVLRELDGGAKAGHACAHDEKINGRGVGHQLSGYQEPGERGSKGARERVGAVWIGATMGAIFPEKKHACEMYCIRRYGDPRAICAGDCGVGRIRGVLQSSGDAGAGLDHVADRRIRVL